nr:hypothetical protein [Mycoplasmopsis bovis]
MTKIRLEKSLTCSKFSGEIEILGGKKINVSDVLAIKDENKVLSLAICYGLWEFCSWWKY